MDYGITVFATHSLKLIPLRKITTVVLKNEIPTDASSYKFL